MARKPNPVVAFANQKLSVKTAAIILASSTLFSSLLGLFRDRLLNGYYLDNYPTGIDAYTVAFIIPDIMFSILVSGALSVTLVPIFNQLRNDQRTTDDRQAWDLASSMVNFMSLVGLGISLFIMIFADQLIQYVVGPNLSEASRALAASMMRIIAINPFLFSISGVLSSIQQAAGRFVFYAIAPAIYNLGIIIGTLFFTDGINLFGRQIFEGGIMGVALGVLLGSILQLVVSSIGIIGLGFDYKFRINWKNRGFRKVMGLFPARSLDQGIDYFNSLIETRLASGMASGTIRAYNQALTLHTMPVNLIGVAIANASFSSLTEKLALDQTAQFREQVQSILRVVVWISLPVSFITFFTRGYLVNFIKNSGNPLMASLLGSLVVAIFFRSIYHILARTFYAQQDTKTPLYTSLFAAIINIASAIYFVKVLNAGPSGLAYAQSIGAVTEASLLLYFLSRKTKNFFEFDFIKAIAKIAGASFLTGIVTYWMVLLLPLTKNDKSFFATFPKFMIICSVAGVFYVIICRLLQLEEVQALLKRVNQTLFKKLETKKG